MSRNQRIALTLGVIFLLVCVTVGSLCTWMVINALDDYKEGERANASARALSLADRTPQWSSDGKFLVVNVSLDILRIDVATGEVSRIFDDDDWGRYSPLLSPDNRTLAYVRKLEDGIYSSILEITDVDGRRPTNLGKAWPFAWSPDGSRLLYVRPNPGRFELGNEDTYDSVVVYHETEPEISWPIRYRDEVEMAAWSPDGNYIAFLGEIGAESDLFLYITKSDGTEKTEIYRSSDTISGPGWTVDGSLVFAAVEQENGIPQNRLYQVDIDGQNGNMLTEIPTEVVLPGPPMPESTIPKGSISRVIPSPNGAELLLVAPQGRLYVWNKGSQELTRLPPLGSQYWSLSPDGKHIAVSDRIGNKEQIYVVSSDGSDRKLIFDQKTYKLMQGEGE